MRLLGNTDDIGIDFSIGIFVVIEKHRVVAGGNIGEGNRFGGTANLFVLLSVERLVLGKSTLFVIELDDDPPFCPADSGNINGQILR